MREKAAGWFPKNIKKYKNITSCVEAFASYSGASVRHSWKLYGEFGKRIKTIPKDKYKKPKKIIVVKNNNTSVPGSIPLKDMVDKYDIPKAIQAGIKNLGTSVIYDEDFRRYLNLSSDKWRRSSSLKIFDGNKLQRGNKRIVWGCKESIKQIIRKIDIVE